MCGLLNVKIIDEINLSFKNCSIKQIQWPYNAALNWRILLHASENCPISDTCNRSTFNRSIIIWNNMKNCNPHDASQLLTNTVNLSKLYVLRYSGVPLFDCKHKLTLLSGDLNLMDARVCSLRILFSTRVHCIVFLHFILKFICQHPLRSQLYNI